MINFPIYFLKIFFLFFLLSACEQTSSIDPADHRDKDTISRKQLNDIISNADAGNTVHLKSAVYIIDGNIEMTPGITLKEYLQVKQYLMLGLAMMNYLKSIMRPQV